jgi:hypothetical protein
MAVYFNRMSFLESIEWGKTRILIMDIDMDNYLGLSTDLRPDLNRYNQQHIAVFGRMRVGSLVDNYKKYMHEQLHADIS